MKETRIRLEDSDHQRLRVAAALAGLSMAEFVKRATLEAIKRQEARGDATEN
jgi:predicted HicB family RNase H-like nuclease